jgi:hypothetical protein
MSLKDIISASIESNPIGLKEAFSLAINERIKTALEEKKLDAVDAKELSKDFKDRDDKDIDNDGDEDDSDEYLHNRRKTIAKAIKKESLDEAKKYKITTDETKKYQQMGANAFKSGITAPVLDPALSHILRTASHESKIEFMKAWLRGWNIENLKESLDEAKMDDSEVLKAAKSLAANGKDAKSKAFGKGLVDFYAKNDSFTPAQVGGLQNIMKNASFQFAKEDYMFEAKMPKAITKESLDEVSMDLAKKVQKDRKELGNLWRNKAGIVSGTKDYSMDQAIKNFDKANKTKSIIDNRMKKEETDLEEEDYMFEAKMTKAVFGSNDGFSYAVNLNGADNEFFKQPFGRQLDTLKKVKEFTAKAKKGSVGAKGKPTLAAVKDWVKMNQPTQFYAKWKMDSKSYKDDSVEIYYTD